MCICDECAIDVVGQDVSRVRKLCQLPLRNALKPTWAVTSWARAVIWFFLFVSTQCLFCERLWMRYSNYWRPSYCCCDTSQWRHVICADVSRQHVLLTLCVMCLCKRGVAEICDELTTSDTVCLGLSLKEQTRSASTLLLFLLHSFVPCKQLAFNLQSYWLPWLNTGVWS